ncbi:MAG: ABC transporter substrate-binding protein [Oscillospiraceae bacterium]|nr:ABC transporter substrate-binding protein [Oscillospiraceae bacterium]
MKTRKTLALLLSVVMLVGLLAAIGPAAAAADDLPRDETLYFGGQQWGPVNGTNPLSTNNNNGMAVAANARGSRTIMFETLYMYNSLDGKLYPLLADGDYKWNDDLTEMTVAIKAAAKWNDGTPVTAEDMAATWAACEKVANGTYADYSAYIDAVEAVDGNVVIKAKKTEDGKPVNPLQVLNFLSGVYVQQAKWLDTLFERNSDDTTKILEDPAEDVAFSGPYGPYIYNDQLAAFVRNDDYWGQDASMWGKLPAPKYIAHALYSDNDAALVAFKAGQIDVNQQFIANVQNLWEKEGLPIATYMDEAPYGICATMPTAWYNMEIPALQNVAVRKAIAMAVDYDDIIENAMTNQSPSFADVPRSVMNPTDGEQAMYDHEAVKDLQWVGKDIEGAKKLLDEAGIVDTDGDGYRELDGKKIELNACCPNGWTDWMAAMEDVAKAGQAIGIDITTNYPTWDIYQTVYTKASQTEYAIFMQSPAGANPASPWARVRALMSSEFLGKDNNWSGNFGHYQNDRIDEILAAIPLTTDEAELKALYTEATEIYLTEVPSFSLMYRPEVFHAVNESVWTGYPEAGDGNNIPPMDCTDGYGIAALYNLELVG